MPTPAQYAANRLNAQKSQGPTTPQGRVRSKMNALRHGLTARVVVLPTEDMDAYNAFSKEIVDSLDAQTPVERQFAQTVADNQWRINRIRSIEDGMLGMGHFESAGDCDAANPEIHSAMTAARAFREDSKAFVNLSIYEQRLHRSMKDALRQLKELQTRAPRTPRNRNGRRHPSSQNAANERLVLRSRGKWVRFFERRNRLRSQPPRPPPSR